MRRLFYKCSITAVLLLSLWMRAYGVVEHFYNSIDGVHFAADSSITVKDDKYGTSLWSDIVKNALATDVVTLQLNEDTALFLSANHTCKVDVEITWTQSNGTVDSMAKTLQIAYDTAKGKAFNFRSSFRFNGGYIVKTRILSVYYDGVISTSYPKVFALSEDIYITRFYKFNCDSLMTVTPSYNSTYQRVDLNWTPMLGADEYDVEYTFYDSASALVLNEVAHPSTSYTDFGFVFNGNATRVTVSGGFVDLSTVFNHGWILARLRPVNYDSLGNRITGRWTSDVGTSTGISSYFSSNGYYWAGHMPALNWQYTAAYAEEGKRKEVASYFDGTLRNRQSVTMNNTENKAIVGETMYDHQGRAALTTLPAPIDTGKLYFYNNYNLNSAGVEYSRHDFDTGSCGFIPPPMDSVTSGSAERGSSGYYSSSNPDKGTGFAAYLPDAQGYPFTQTEYTLDNTGRISRQSIADKTHTLGSGHETQYFYGKPSQPQLDRLFGSEVGDNSHYQENMVMDANGQVSVSYIDANGKTIATALAGQPSTNTQPLPSYTSATTLYVNLLDEGANQINSTTLESSYGLLATNAGRYYFTYRLYPGNYTDSTCSAHVCTDCLYDITLMVTDNCGGDNPLVIHHDTNFTYASTHPFDTLCSHTNITDTFSVYLEPGEYNISRQISIDPGALNFYEAYNLRHNTCLKSYSTFLSSAIANTDFTGCGETCTQCLAALGTSSAFLTKYITELKTAGDSIPSHQDTLSADTAYAEAKINCNALCAVPSVCSDLYNEMLADVSLGGQYCKDTLISGKDTTLDPTSMLAGQYKTPCTSYKNSAGQPDTVIINGVKYLPTQLSINEFVLNWKPSWAASLVCDHPEYCYYTYCQLDTASNRFDAAFEDSTSFLGAWNAGFINPLGDSSYPATGSGHYYNINWKDPYFRGGQGSALLHNMFNRMRYYLVINPGGIPTTLSIWQVAALEAYCAQDTLSGISLSHCYPGPNFDSGCAGNENMNWEMFRGLYLSLKQKVQDSLENIYVAGHGCNADAACIGQTGCGNYNNKVPRNVTAAYAETKTSYEPGGTKSESSESSWFTSHMKSDCDSMCRAEAQAWYDELLGCGSIEHTDSAALVSGLIQVCDSGCNSTHPFGSSTMPHWRADANGDHSFEDVIHRVLGVAKDSLPCDSVDITMPPPYADSNGVTGPQVTFYKPDTCICNKLTYYYNNYYQSDSESGDTYYKNYADWLSKNLGGSLTENQVYTLMSACSGTCFYLPTALQLPNWLNCCGNSSFNLTHNPGAPGDTTAPIAITHCCISCNDIEGAIRIFILNSPAGTDTARQYQEWLETFLNQTFNFDLTYEQYMKFYNTCKDSTVVTSPTMPACFTCAMCTEKLVPSLPLTLCNEPINTVPPAVDTNPCYTYLMMDAGYNAQTNYNNYIDSVNTTFTANYIKHCMSIDDSFHLSMPFDEYHYTLYYYDQAENLVKTVPPKGVVPISSTASLDSVENYRLGKAGYNPVYPIYDSLQTRYWYNTLNSPALQVTPDGDTTRFWYDRLGRLCLSQNAVQKPYAFSFTQYDALDRIIVVGQLNTGATKIQPGSFVRNDATLANFIRHWTRTQVTHTYYDTAIYTSLPITQNNLRKRIASITYEDVDDSNVNTYDNAIHYSYDIEGDVATLLNDNKHNSLVKQQFKRVDYYYDLVSGKVNEVIYQHDSTDQFMQIYEYDADNRITNVITSRDSVYFENDASYEFYDHGPIARQVIGQRQVQGVDYAYTLNGWLKGKNSSILNPSYDIGHDGDIYPVGGGQTTIARDALGFTLEYFNGDYRAIGSSAFEAYGLPDTSLYNGNIVGATYSIKELSPKTIGYKYTYDQLNRLTDLVAYNTIDTVNDKWNSPSPVKDFQEELAYDENGNITKNVMHGNTAIGSEAMDSLNYYYNKKSDQLNYVTNGAHPGNYPNEMPNESFNNYMYNAVGELVKDTANGIDTITWTVYGKIKKIIKNGYIDSLVFEYDPMGNRIEKRFYTKVHHGPIEVTYADTTLYDRDAQGNILSIRDRNQDTVRLDEWDIYGKTRVGSVDTLMRLYPKPTITSGGSIDSSTIAYLEGQKQYELDNHLGNVMVTLSDRKWAIDTSLTPNVANYYLPNIVSANDYYPFGSMEPGRTFMLVNDSSYHFGFNGKLKENSIYGNDAVYDFTARMYNAVLGRFFSPDPDQSKYPSWSPYSFCYDNPIISTDPDGKGINVNKEEAANGPSDFSAISAPGGIGNTGGGYVLDNYNTETKSIDLEVNISIQYTSAFVVPGRNGKTFEQENPGLLLSVQTHEHLHAQAMIDAANTIFSYSTNSFGTAQTYTGTIDKIATALYNDHMTQYQKLIKQAAADIEQKYANAKGADVEKQKAAEMKTAQATIMNQEFGVKFKKEEQDLIDMVKKKYDELTQDYNQNNNGVVQQTINKLPAGSNAQKYELGTKKIMYQGKKVSDKAIK